jgi:undecaprenyl-diphosphatase
MFLPEWVPSVGFDATITAGLNALAGRWPALDLVVSAFAKTGPYLVVGSIALRWWAGKERTQARFVAICCGLSTALGLLINQGVLLVFDRVRPYDAGVTHLVVAPSADPSFPSDHAAVAFAVAFALLLRRDRWARAYMAAALAMGAARVYIGIHDLTDIIGGAGTAALAALAVAVFYGAESTLNRRLVRLF